VSWLVYRDVSEGREHFNFSEWDMYPSVPEGMGEREKHQHRLQTNDIVRFSRSVNTKRIKQKGLGLHGANGYTIHACAMLRIILHFIKTITFEN
jgi:hypothetical protein